MLGRKYRNTPEDACRDAITPYMIIVGVPVTVVVVAFLFALFPGLLQSKDWVPWVTVPTGILLYLMTRSLQRYALTPEIAAPFRSPSSRRVTFAIYLGILVLSLIVAVVGGQTMARIWARS